MGISAAAKKAIEQAKNGSTTSSQNQVSNDELLKQVETILGPFVDDLSPTGDQLRGTCPFCDKADHFYISGKTLWKCQRCGEQGNLNTFFSGILDKCKAASTHKSKQKELSKWRSIELRTLNRAGITYDPVLQRYLIPYMGSKHPKSYRYVAKIGGKVMNPSSLPLEIYGQEYLLNSRYKSYDVIVCEGEWDTLKTREVVTKAKMKAIVVGVPGAGIFKEEWLQYFKDRDVSLIFDNDMAGTKGMDRACDLLSKVVKHLKRIQWTAAHPNKYDASDYFIASEAANKSPEDSLQELALLLRPVQLNRPKGTPAIAPTPITPVGHDITWPELVNEYTKHMSWCDDYTDALKVVLATTISVRHPGMNNPLWSFLVGAPGTAKTVILSSCAQDPEYTNMQSVITRPVLISGMPNDEDGTDPSLLPLIIGKCLFVKDYTEILGMNAMAQEELNSALRGIYDGRVDRRLYGGKVQRSYQGTFSMVAATTLKIHGHSEATVGERFLKYQLLMDPEQNRANALAALDNMDNEIKRDAHLGNFVANFIKQNIDKKRPPLTRRQKRKLVSLGHLTALMRAKVDRVGYGDEAMQYRAEAESPTRLSLQLAKLVRNVAIVMQRDKVDRDCMKLAERVALDTSIGFNIDIVEAMMDHGTQLTRHDIEDLCHLNYSNVNRSMIDLESLGLVTRTKGKPKKGRGATPDLYAPTPELQGTWEACNLSQKTRDKFYRHRRNGHVASEA